MTVSVERLTEIADEVLTLMDAHDIFAFLDDSTPQKLPTLELRLQEVMKGRHQFETIELAMYLRTCSSRSDRLPTWQPLLNAAYELCLMRSEDPAVFYGLLPHELTLIRNTEGVTGPRHPQMQKR